MEKDSLQRALSLELSHFIEMKSQWEAYETAEAKKKKKRIRRLKRKSERDEGFGGVYHHPLDTQER